ncbi:hypothetical protein GIB67_012565 [Kingdonia uniflora]|uniref:ATP-dependent Clp protease proteolytic subunit n=1 Tax=Kingdonia uniflora TaxID=39325 RepID=A0A7J7NFL7_9MAGN|nr:hypothetical protein GIB67_012565 [Kingdonia uniflora]
MATSVISPTTTMGTTQQQQQLGSPFVHGDTNKRGLFSLPSPPSLLKFRKSKSPCISNSLNHIPKQFREENLKDGLMDNYKNAPKLLYGLAPSQMDIFMTDDGPIKRQADKVTEASISSAKNYLDHSGMMRLSSLRDAGPEAGPARYSNRVSAYHGGGRGYGRARSAPPDLPSLLLDARIVFLGMPIVPPVTELLVAQFMWLDFDDSTKPIYLYINSPGTQNEKMEIVASETEAFAIADAMSRCKPEVYTLNMSMAFGQAAMLLSLGKKGHRFLQPNASTKIYLPKVNRSSGASTDMWIKAKELDSNTDSYVELLAKGLGKPEEEVRKDIQFGPKYFRPQEAIDYGIADKIIEPSDLQYEKKNYDELLAKSKAMRKAGAQPLPSALR